MTPIAIAVALAVVALLFVVAPLLRAKTGQGNEREGSAPGRAEEEAEEAGEDVVAQPVSGEPSASAISLDEEAEALIRAARRDVVTCATCGERPEPGAHFCSSCGRRLAGCPTCGAPVQDASAHFCTACGAPLGA